MKFKVHSLNETDFEAWAKKQYNSNSIPLLTSESYAKLAEESHDNPPTTYMLMNNNLYNEVIMKYMPAEGSKTMSGSGKTM